MSTVLLTTCSLAMSSRITKTFPALSEDTVRRYLTGQFCSVVGTWTQNITLSLLLWELTHSALLLGVLNFLLHAPMLGLPLLFGSRLHPATIRRDTLVILLAGLLLAVALLVGSVLDALQPTLLVASAAVIGILNAMEMPARQLLLTSSLTNRSLLLNAVAMNTMVFNVGRIGGPALAALVFSAGGATAGFAICACGLLLMLYAVYSLPDNPNHITQAHSTRGTIPAAIRYCRADPFITHYMPLLIGLGIFAASYQTLIPVLAAVSFGSAATYTGVFFACTGAGALSAAVMLSTKQTATLMNKLLVNAPWLSTLALAGIAVSRWTVLTGLCFALLGLSISFFTTRINAIMQRRSPHPLRGAVVGIYAMSFLGTLPLGLLAAGAISDKIGPQWTFALMAACLGILQGAVLWQRQHHRHADEDIDKGDDADGHQPHTPMA